MTRANSFENEVAKLYQDSKAIMETDRTPEEESDFKKSLAAYVQVKDQEPKSISGWAIWNHDQMKAEFDRRVKNGEDVSDLKHPYMDRLRFKYCY